MPPVDYRNSVDYGLVEMTTSKSSQNEDLFGSAMSKFAKISGKALPNGMIIGEGLFNLFENAFDGNYIVKPEGEVILGLEGREKFSVYPVESKGKNALNPFKHKIF